MKMLELFGMLKSPLAYPWMLKAPLAELFFKTFINHRERRAFNGEHRDYLLL
jgi:hypothetical protein